MRFANKKKTTIIISAVTAAVIAVGAAVAIPVALRARNSGKTGGGESRPGSSVSESGSAVAVTSGESEIESAGNPSVTSDASERGDIEAGSSDMIAEVVGDICETNDGSVNDYRSRPTNSILPKGTVDYCKPGEEYDKSNDDYYMLLRCGRRVISRRNRSSGASGKVVITKQYEGKLPDHNEIAVVGMSNGEASSPSKSSHTTLTLKPKWKAPFLLSLLPQEYTNASTRDYTVASQTFRYVEIKFYYATVFEGDIEVPADNTLFSRAEIVRGKSDTTLRLYLKRTGKFFGWDCEYDSKGRMVFEFLNPAKITNDPSGKYGVNLKNVRIMIDVGHGGADSGAAAASKNLPAEADRNLFLAQKVQKELESAGATVIMNRTDNATVDSEKRRLLLKNAAPDFCLSVHHDSGAQAGVDGFGAFHYYAFSSDAARFIFNQTLKTGIYSTQNRGNHTTRLKWHYYYVGRLPTCTHVLTENGYMSNPGDLVGINDDAVNNRKAEAIVRGIAEYFQSIQ